ncbi:MAG: DUF4830 domain-containing protein [Oscillospiraceae bacterium]|nr:DUF4830 domain-containing protein [Oscillospiraceae bacterium]
MSKVSSKKGLKIFLFLLLAVIAITALMFFSKAKAETEADEFFTMSSSAERVEFLNRQGWIVKPDPISKEEITIPSVFDGVYADYAELQKSQGFDLEPYKGKTATAITYQVLNYPDYPENVTATMLILDDRLIGGDISLAGDNGFTVPLITAGTQSMLTSDQPDTAE